MKRKGKPFFKKGSYEKILTAWWFLCSGYALTLCWGEPDVLAWIGFTLYVGLFLANWYKVWRMQRTFFTLKTYKKILEKCEDKVGRAYYYTLRHGWAKDDIDKYIRLRRLIESRMVWEGIYLTHLRR